MTTRSVSSVLPSLRIAVIGVGGIGSTFAFQLARAGHQVTAVARPGSARLLQLQRDGAIVNVEGQRADVQVAADLDATLPYDLLLVTVQAQHMDAVLPALERSSAKWVQFMCNTFEPERLRDAVGAERCSFGMPFVQATVSQTGVLRAKIGAGGQKSKMNHQGWVEVFRAAGLPAIFEPDMLLWLRCHAPLGAAFESVCATAMRRGKGASWADATRIARGLQESFTLIQRLGYRLYPAGKSRLHSSPLWVVAGMLWSVSRIRSFRELLATGVNECRALIEALALAAPQAKPPVRLETIRGLEP